MALKDREFLSIQGLSAKPIKKMETVNNHEASDYTEGLLFWGD